MRPYLALAARLVGLAAMSLAVLSQPADIASARPAIAVPVGFVDHFMATVSRPTGLAHTPDGRLLITAQGGQLWVYQGGLQLQPALNLAPYVCDNNERGLGGVAVDPNFADNHYIYLYYTFKKHGVCPLADPANPHNPVNRVARFTLPDNNVILTTTQMVLVDNITQSYGIHNGGDLHFGADGLLYISTGDGAGPNGTFLNPQSLAYLGAKILRVNADGTIPASNPYAAAANSRHCGDPAGVPPGSGPCRETFASGLRNPFRFAFKPGTNVFYINDVGQSVWEEINLGVSGANYGWNVREGPCPFSDPGCNPGTTPNPAQFTAPIHFYNHNIGCYSITGGAFVPPGIWPVEYDNAYLFADFGCGRIWRLVGSGYASTRATFASGLGQNSLIAMIFVPHESTQALYYVKFDGVSGQLRRITYTGQVNRPPTAALAADPVYGAAPLDVTLSAAGSADPDLADVLTYEWTFGDGTVLTSTSAVTVTHPYAMGVYTASLVVRDNRGAASDTLSVRIDSGNTPPVPVMERVGLDEPFAVGDLLAWEGAATDAEDPSEALALAWEARLHHIDADLPGNAHFHPYLALTPGEAISLTAPAPEDFGATALSFLELRLIATDTGGLSGVVTAVVEPNRVPLQFETVPPGFELLLGGQSVTGPRTATSWENWAFSAEAPLQTDAAGSRWDWQAWEAGEPLTATRTVTTTAATGVYTATFTTTDHAPVPLVLKIDPAIVPPGAPQALTMTVTGKNFASEAQVLWDGQPLATTTFISSTQLLALVPAELLAESGAVPVSAQNPAPGGGIAPALEFLQRLRLWLPAAAWAGP